MTPHENAHQTNTFVPVRPRRVEIQDPNMVKALFDARQLNMLRPFIREPSTVSEAAQLTDSLPTTMLGFVRRARAGGLLREADIVRRSGKRVRRYWTTASEFFVPIDCAEEVMLAPEMRYQKLFNDALRAEILEHHYNIEPLGALIALSANGAVQITGALSNGSEWIPGSNGPPVEFHWSVLKLDDADVYSLQRDIAELFAAYNVRPEGHRSFYVGAHLAPVPITHAINQIVNASPGAR